MKQKNSHLPVTEENIRKTIQEIIRSHHTAQAIKTKSRPPRIPDYLELIFGTNRNGSPPQQGLAGTTKAPINQLLIKNRL